MVLLSLEGLCMPSSCGEHMEELLSPVVDFAVQSVTEGPPNACKKIVLGTSCCHLSNFPINSVRRLLTCLMSTQ